IPPATRGRLEQVWSDSFSRLLASELEHIRTKSNRQSPRMLRPAQTTECRMSVCSLTLFALLSSLISRVRIVPFCSAQKVFHLKFVYQTRNGWEAFIPIGPIGNPNVVTKRSARALDQLGNQSQK